MDFKELLEGRHSIRSFTPEKLTDELLDKVLDAGRMAPSAHNNQPWLFVVVNDSDTLQQLSQAYPRSWFSRAPQVIVVCADHQQSWKRAIDQKDHADIDIAIATDHMTLRACELGLGTCWVCHFDPEKAAEALNLPQHVEPVVFLPIGRPDETKVPPKKRKSLNEVVRFNGY